MTERGRVFWAAAVLMLAPVVAFAQDPQTGFQEGEREFTLVGSGSSDEDFDNTGFAASFSLGQFFTDNFEGGVRQDVTFIDVPGGSDWNASTRLAGDYHFGVGPAVPLVGISIGYVYGDNVNEQFIAGPEVGLKYFLNQTTFFYGLVEYQFLFEDADEADEQFDDGRFVYGLGLGLTF